VDLDHSRPNPTLMRITPIYAETASLLSSIRMILTSLDGHGFRGRGTAEPHTTPARLSEGIRPMSRRGHPAGRGHRGHHRAHLRRRFSFALPHGRNRRRRPALAANDYCLEQCGDILPPGENGKRHPGRHPVAPDGRPPARPTRPTRLDRYANLVYNYAGAHRRPDRQRTSTTPRSGVPAGQGRAHLFRRARDVTIRARQRPPERPTSPAPPGPAPCFGAGFAGAEGPSVHYGPAAPRRPGHADLVRRRRAGQP